MRVPVNLFKKCFNILWITCVCLYLLQIVSTAIGHPFAEVSALFFDIEDTKIWTWLFEPIFTATNLGAIVNFFLTARIIKEAIGFKHWPVYVVVIMVFLFPIEYLISIFLVVPNLIIFGIKGRTKNRAYEVEF